MATISMLRVVYPDCPTSFMPAATIIPNITIAAPPRTAWGMAAIIAASFGTRPHRIRKIAPIVTT